MRHMAYFAMVKCVEKLGPKVKDVLAEPLGAYIANQYSMAHHNQQETCWGPEVPDCLRIVWIIDFGAGKQTWLGMLGSNATPPRYNGYQRNGAHEN